MAMIAIYTRDDAGLITYLGQQDWGSRAQIIEHYYLTETPEHERLLGWHHPSVSWHGNTGFGEDA
jgi:hypothetical protein